MRNKKRNWTENCVLCGKPATMHTGTVWNSLRKKHVIAGFCEDHEQTCRYVKEKALLPHIPDYKTIDINKHRDRIHNHLGLYCYGIYNGE